MAAFKEIIRKEIKVIPLANPLVEASKGLNRTTVFPNSHYNESFNAVVGKEIARQLLKQRKRIVAPFPQN